MSNRFSLGDAIVLGLSSSGPAQTLAVSLASMVAVCRYGGVVPVLVCFVPMLGIAIGYQRLNRWDPSAGATYTWVAKVFHPYLGFLAGWMILLYYTLGTSSLTIPAGTYTLELLAPRLVASHLAVALTGGAWNVLVTLLALRGLKVAARFEWAVVVFQYVVLLLVAAAGIAALLHSTSAVAFSWDWFTLGGMGGMRGLMGGILVACFMYSGWDAAVYVNEESTDKVESPGQAAIASVVILALFYAVTLFGLQATLPPAELQEHAGNALAVIASRLLPGSWGAVMSLVVLTGTLATLQAAVIAAARVGFAMSRDGVMPRAFRRVDPRTGNPWVATVVMSTINLCLLALALATTNIARALGNVVSSLGLISILFYGLTGAAAVWQNRRALSRSPADLVLGGVLPGFGALFMVWVTVESVRSGATSPVILAYGIGSVALGALVAVLVRRLGATTFFNPAALHDDPPFSREQPL
ncbi:MAG TPA: APC family permease [Steroidobacteraceae bacterium]|nr:APC family permease [Steroidobacteraceae bacterium]